jgi:hypothetical protein
VVPRLLANMSFGQFMAAGRFRLASCSFLLTGRSANSGLRSQSRVTRVYEHVTPLMACAHNRFTRSCHTGSASTGRNVSAGTVITKANWRKYKDCFSDGIQAFWQGAYFWKISEDVENHVGNPAPTRIPR